MTKYPALELLRSGTFRGGTCRICALGDCGDWGEGGYGDLRKPLFGAGVLGRRLGFGWSEVSRAVASLTDAAPFVGLIG